MKDRVVEVWPENWPAFCLFCDLDTQWRIGMAGPTGLDYTALNSELDDLDLPKDERLQMKTDIRVMERAALVAMRAED